MHAIKSVNQFHHSILRGFGSVLRIVAASVTVQGRVWQWWFQSVQTTQPAFTIYEVHVTQLIPDLTARPCDARAVGK